MTVRDGQDRLVLPKELPLRLISCGERVLALIRERGLARSELPPVIAVTLLDDAAMARVHGEFLGDPTPTDVITFPYEDLGEILIGVETARQQGKDHGCELDRELALYLVHGILHLCGYHDHTESDQEVMNRLQEELLKTVWDERA